MSSAPSVIVNKSGFLASVARGFFGLLTACVVCATGLGGYAIYSLRESGFDAAHVIGKVVESLPEWQKAMPPAVAEAFDDRRAPEYRDKLDIKVTLVESRHNHARALIEVTNRGDKVVSLLALHANVLDDRGLPIGGKLTYAVSPIAVSHEEWPGPLLPGSTRIIERWIDADRADRAQTEIAELRVCRTAAEREVASARP